ncbi:MAG: PstS family phosphate ABC transporter substrate-binding protein [Halodesulfurarchaeum sp.]
MARPSHDRLLTRRSVLESAGAAGIVGLAGCTGGGGSGGSGNSLSGEVQIAGSSTVFPISRALSKKFQKKHPQVSIPVSSTGTGAGFSNFFCPGKTDINDASRPITDRERQICRSNNVTPIRFKIATDALSMVVNPKADWVDCLTFEELQTIWGPSEPVPQQWSDVKSSWPDKPLRLYGPTSASGTFDYFTERVMGKEGAHRADYQGTEHDNNIVTAVAGDRYAMGYLGFAYYVDNKDKLKGLGIDGPKTEQCVKPTFKTAKSGRYPLARPLYIYVAESALKVETVRKFVRFYIEQSATDFIRKIGYVPVTQSTKKENLQKLEAAIKRVTG